MGEFYPVLLCFIQIMYGGFVFQTPKIGNGPVMSTIIFMMAILILLWDTRLYPKSLKKLGKSGQFIVEYLISLYTFEFIITSFWCPLETSTLEGLVKLSEKFEKPLICDFLNSKFSKTITSYGMSVFFLGAVLYATRAMDFTLIFCRPKSFVAQINMNLRNFLAKRLKTFGLGSKVQQLPECEFDELTTDVDESDNEYSTISTSRPETGTNYEQCSSYRNQRRRSSRHH